MDEGWIWRGVRQRADLRPSCNSSLISLQGTALAFFRRYLHVGTAVIAGRQRRLARLIGGRQWTLERTRVIVQGPNALSRFARCIIGLLTAFQLVPRLTIYAAPRCSRCFRLRDFTVYVPKVHTGLHRVSSMERMSAYVTVGSDHPRATHSGLRDFGHRALLYVSR